MAGRWFSPVSSANKTDRYDITETLLTGIKHNNPLKASMHALILNNNNIVKRACKQSYGPQFNKTNNRLSPQTIARNKHPRHW